MIKWMHVDNGKGSIGRGIRDRGWSDNILRQIWSDIVHDVCMVVVYIKIYAITATITLIILLSRH